MKMAITTLSSKGQIVLPKEIREDLHVGEQFLILREGNNIILKPKNSIGEQLKEDLEFARRSDEALERLEKGEGVTMEFDEFIDEIKKW
jgi:AbrB family looped-hinge helix DNA binding protein